LLRLTAVKAFLRGAAWNLQADPLSAESLPGAADHAALDEAASALDALRAQGEPLSPGMVRLAALTAMAQGGNAAALGELDAAETRYPGDVGLAITRAALLAQVDDPAQASAWRAAGETPGRFLAVVDKLVQLEEPEAALIWAERAAVAFPGARAVWHALGSLQAGSGDPAAALASYRRGLEAADASAGVGASNLLYAIGRTGTRNPALIAQDEAQANLREALALDDFGALPAERSDAHFQLGHMAFSAGDFAGAAAAYEAAVAAAVTADQRYLARVSLANALWVLGRRAEAMALLEEAMPIAPQRTEAPLLLAQMAAATGDTARARALYAGVLALDPDDTTAQQGAVAPESVPSTLPGP
jgi:tetratricopeptide (TPR) repeat protein